jgi:uncharacterized protein (TIGR02996 family)
VKLPHPELLGLLRACKEEPNNDAPRLILADWLDEHGDTTRGRLVRLQCLAARMSHRERKHQRTEERARVLAEKCSAWLRPLNEANLSPVFQRGLLHVTAAHDMPLRPKAWGLADSEPWAWVESVAVNGPQWRLPELQDWLASGLLRGVATLHLGSFDLNARGAKGLADADLPLLRELWLSSWHLTAAGLRRLGRSPVADRLRILWVREGRLSEELGTALAAGSWKSLRELDLHGTRLGNGGGEALGRAAWLAGLTRLDARSNDIGPGGVRALLAGPRAVSAAAVWLANNPIGDEGAAVVAAAPGMSQATSLDLSNCDLGASGAQALASSPGVANLTTLNLCNNRIGDEGIAALARSPYLTRLHKLYLGYNDIGNAGARVLAASTHLSGLQGVWLHNNHRMDASGWQVLLERFGSGAV